MDRREFIKSGTVGAALIGASSLGLGSCGEKDNAELPLGPVVQNFKDIGLLGFGTMRWPMMDDGQGNKVVDQQKVDEMIDLAIANGVNYFDSAPVYLGGQSEPSTGLSLSRYPRQSYYVATKLSNFKAPYTYDGGVEMYRKSLENFRTDYIDYYLLHSLSGYQDFKERFLDNGLIDFCIRERELGHIRNLGFSFHGRLDGFKELVELNSTYHWDFVQIQMNYLDWNHSGTEASAKEMYRILSEMGIPAVIMEPLRGGDLASLPAPLADQLTVRRPDSSIASWAFRFAGSFPDVMTVLSGMSQIAHLRDNLKTYTNFESVTDDEKNLLESIARNLTEYKLIPCTGCQYCMPCPFGIDIPAIFKFYNRNLKDGTYVVSTEQKNYRKARQKYLADYDNSIERLHQADHCIKCRKCLAKCPQHIRIPDELYSIYQYVEKLKTGRGLE